MEEAPKLLYVVVVDDEGEEKGDVDSIEASSYRYTRLALQNTLQLMGCKPRHAFKISRRVFEVLRRERAEDAAVTETSKSDTSRGHTDHQKSPLKILERSNSSYFALYKILTTVVVLREKFLNVVCDALSQYKYVGPYQREDLVLACRIKERKESVTILLCGTSGCGKSTLSALLGSRLGITTVISTDSIRHMMRSFVDEKQNPLLWSSTYQAGEYLDPVAVAKEKDRRRAEKRSGVSPLQSNVELSDEVSIEKFGASPPHAGLNKTLIGQKQMAIEGYKAQSEMVIDSLDRLITAWEDRKESVVVEGVHLSLNFVMDLMKKHPSIIPFMIYISNEDKHMERFAVRAKYMTLDPAKNKYVKYIRNIRAIQDYLCNRADKYLVPKINNTNVDRSVAAIHATVFSCLRRRTSGEHLVDHSTHTVPIVDEEYRRQRSANSLGSKGMLQLIQRQGSSRHMIAIFNVDGSVAKAWHMESSKCNGNSEPGSGNKKNLGNPLYGPLRIGKAEPVNLHFGNFGISAWPNDTGGTRHGGSNEDSRPDETETASRHSSCSSVPSVLGGPSKEIKEGSSVSGSDEATEDHHDSDEDFTDLDNKINDEIEGSVDEESSESDEEYEDLAMHDNGLENEYQSDDDEPEKSVPERIIQPPPLMKRSLEN